MFNVSKFIFKTLNIGGMTLSQSVNKGQSSSKKGTTTRNIRNVEHWYSIDCDPILLISGVSTQKERRIDLKKVTQFVDTLYDVLYIYGYTDLSSSPERTKSQKEKTIRDKLNLRNLYLDFVFKAGFGSWKDLCKYKICAFQSWAMKQDIPPPPKGLEGFTSLLSPSFLVKGRAKRFMNHLLLDKYMKESFAQSIAQSKKGAPAVHKSAVEEAEYKTFLHLTTPRKDLPDFEIFDGVFWHQINRNTMCYQLRRTIRELLGKEILTLEDLSSPFVASSSSQYNWTRNDLGAIGAFLSNDAIRKHIIDIKDLELIKKKLGSVVLSGELTELYGKAGKEDQEVLDEPENARLKETLALLFDGGELCEVWKEKIFPTLIEEALEELPRTMIIGLPEPLKVRCITAGPPITYTALKPVQKWLWKCLKKSSCLQLIGTPVTESIVGTMMGTLGEGEEFISGDYKASTDNLHSWVSECLLDELIEIFKEKVELGGIGLELIAKLKILMKRALTGHSILNPQLNASYRKGNNLRDEDFSLQQEGQLMGSIISFPFLCLANVAMCRWSMEIADNKNYRVTDRRIDGYERARLLANGDDCLFLGKKESFKRDFEDNIYKVPGIFEIWSKITAFGGLESSVGKTFRSRKFMTINSVQYRYLNSPSGWEDENLSGFSSDVSYSELKYVNMGLIYAQKKDGTRGKHFHTLGSIHQDLFDTCPSALFERATELFIRNAKQRRYRKVLDKKTGKPILDDMGSPVLVEKFFYSIKNAEVPWFLPSWLGGLGLILPNEKDWEKKEFCMLRKLAKVLKDNMESFKPRDYASFGKWQFHQLVYDNLREFSFLENQNFLNVTHDGTERSLSEEYQKLYNLAVVERLLKDGLEINQDNFKIVHVTPEEQQNQMLTEVFIHNKKMWKRLYRDYLHTAGGMLSVEDLCGETKNFPLSCFDDRK